MTEPAVRSGRTGAEHVVVVGDGPLAEGLAVRLGATHAPFLPADARAAAEVLREASTVVAVAHAGDFSIDHADADFRREHVVQLAQRAGLAAIAVGARVVGISSAIVCGAAPGRALIGDHEPVDPEAAETPGLVGALAAFEAALAEATRECVRPVAVLRLAAVVGPGIDTLVTRHFEAPRVLVVKDAARDWQFVHLDDLAQAVRVVIADGLTGYLGVGSLRADGTPDVLPSHRVAALAGRRTVTLPTSSAFALAESLHRINVVPAPPQELAFVVYSWTVGAEQLYAAGWRPAWSSVQCAVAIVDGLRTGLTVVGHRVGARDAAALGAAGAAVALLGTAAVWRQARGHH